MSEFTRTPNLQLYLPRVDGDDDAWGDHLNWNTETLDRVLATEPTGLFLPLMGGQMTGPILLTGDPPTDQTEVIAKGYLEDRLTDYLPLVGGSLSGPLHLKPGSPPAADEAVPKSYVDSAITAGTGNFVQKTGDSMSGVLNLNFAHPFITLQSTGSAQSHTIFGTVNGSVRWGLELGNAVAAQDFAINRYSDAGGYVDTPISIRRATGTIDLYGRLVVNGADRMSMEGGTGHGIIRYNNTSRRWWAGVDPGNGPGNWVVFDDSAQRTVLTCQNDGAVYAPTGFWGNYIRSYGNMTVDGALDVNGARIVSRGYNNNPAVAAHNTTGYAVGMWCESGGSLAFGWTDGAGSPNSTRAVIDRGNNFRVYGGVFGDYIYSYGNADFAGSIGVSYNITGGRIRATNGMMNANGAFYVADNEGYYLARGGDGHWRFVEGGTQNLDVSTDGWLYPREGIIGSGLYSRGQVYAGNDWNYYMGVGGAGRIINMSPSWYFNWNSSNGDMQWVTPNGWALHMTGGRWVYAAGGLVCQGAQIVCEGGCYGVRYAAGSYNSNHTFLFGWDNYWSGHLTVSVNNGGAVFPVANAASDERMKTDIQPSRLNALAIVNQIPLVEYDWLDMSDPWAMKQARRKNRKSKITGRRSIGVVAQQVHKIFPEGVIPGDNSENALGGIWSLDLATMFALLIKSVQQLTDRIEELEQAA